MRSRVWKTALSSIGLALCLPACTQNDADPEVMPGEPEAMPPEAEPDVAAPMRPQAHAPGCEELVALHAQPDWRYTDRARPDRCYAYGCESVGDDHFAYFTAPEDGFFRFSVSDRARLLPQADCAAAGEAPLTTGGQVDPINTIERWLNADETYVFGIAGLLDESDGDLQGPIDFTTTVAALGDIDSAHDLPTCADWPAISPAEDGGWAAQGAVRQTVCDFDCGGGTAAQYRFVAPQAGTYRISFAGPQLRVLAGCHRGHPPWFGLDRDALTLTAGQLVAFFIEDRVGAEGAGETDYQLRIERED